MVDVVSLGSINVDRTSYRTAAEIAELAAAHDWFPAAGETRSVQGVPDALLDGAYEDFLGGKAANQAVAAARAGADATLLGKVGRDAGRYEVRDTLRRRGVDVEHVEPAAVPTGKAYVFVDETGENHIALVAGANGEVDDAYVAAKADVVHDADVLLFQNEVPASGVRTLLDGLAERGDRPLVVFDPAPVDGATTLVDHPAVDIVSPNETEYAALGDALDGTAKTLVRRRGPRDVIVSAAGTERFRVTPPSVDVVDTTGAGDVFNGYLAARLARGDPLPEAVRWATWAASHSTELAGAQQAIPERETVADRR